MADHFSGPRALADPASDITDVYAFPSPERPGHLVLVLNSFPVAPATALFSDAVTYRFRLRPLTAQADGGTAAFVAGADEWTFDVQFAPPDPLGPRQSGTCSTPSGALMSFTVGQERAAEGDVLRIFAGPRLDPFFIDLSGVLATEQQERLAFRPTAANFLDNTNVLSIVLEFDVATVLGTGAGPLLGVVGEILTSGGSRPVRLERMGRAEIKNIILRPKAFDPVNRDLEIRDLYNAEDTFDLGTDYVAAYRARLNANLAFFDGLDGSIDWPPDEQGDHPLTDLLLADFLVVDTSKPLSAGGAGDLEIERALLRGRPHTTCGGRSPWHDIIDTLYTLLVGGIEGAPIRDGVDRPARSPIHTFPYLLDPDPEPRDLASVFAPPSSHAEEIR